MCLQIVVEFVICIFARKHLRLCQATKTFAISGAVYPQNLAPYYQKKKEASRPMTSSASNRIDRVNAEIERQNSEFLAADKIVNLEELLDAL